MQRKNASFEPILMKYFYVLSLVSPLSCLFRTFLEINCIAISSRVSTQAQITQAQANSIMTRAHLAQGYNYSNLVSSKFKMGPLYANIWMAYQCAIMLRSLPQTYFV